MTSPAREANATASRFGIERLKDLSTILSLVAIPVILAIVGNRYASAGKERELQGRFVELAVQILSQPDSSPSRGPIRQWAINVVDKYSGVELGDSARGILLRGTPITRSDESKMATQTDLVAVADEPVFLTVQIGYAQPGQSVVQIDGRQVASGEVRALPLGRGSELTGKRLLVLTSVGLVNPGSDRAAVTYVIEQSGRPSRSTTQTLGGGATPATFQYIVVFRLSP